MAFSDPKAACLPSSAREDWRRPHRFGGWIWVLGLGLLAVLGNSNAAVADETWLRIEGSSLARDLWIDLDAERLWLAGTCDGGRPLERLTVAPGRLDMDWAETLQAELGRRQLALTQSWQLTSDGERGTLRLESTHGGTLVVPVQISRHRRRSPPGCGSG